MVRNMSALLIGCCFPRLEKGCWDSNLLSAVPPPERL
jgi:hypothetical protein